MRAATSLLIATTLAFLAGAGSAGAQTATRAGSGAGAPRGPQLAPAPFSDLIWRAIGPTIFSGRIQTIAVARTRGEPDKIYITGATGGVFRSTTGGTTWTPLFDDVNAMMSMGDFVLAPSNPNVMWIGTGEGNNPSHDWGDGVYKSIDAGTTWTKMGLTDTRHIGRIAIHPTNADIVFVAAAGHMWGPNTERGLFKTIDGGRTWKKVLYVDEYTGANDVRIDPTNPQIMYASTYQRGRKNWGGIHVGPGSAIYKSMDGGETWRKLTNGIPSANKGRIGLSMSPVDSKLLYADIEVSGAVFPGGGTSVDCPPDVGRGRGGAPPRGQFDAGEGGVYRSIDGGETWEHVYARADQPVGYFSQMRPDPVLRNRVYRLGTGFYVSDDMGKTFRTLSTNLHGDYHDFWVDSNDPSHMLIANDGGLGVSWDAGATYNYRNNIPLPQYYEIDVSNHDPFWVCGGVQDNGSWCIRSAVRNRNGISNRDAFSVGSGDGMHFRVDPLDTNYAFVEPQSGAGNQGNVQRLSLTSLARETVKPGTTRPISCFEATIPAGGRLQPPLRWGWDTPIVFSSLDRNSMYIAANVLFKSTDHGGSWKAISGDLTAKVDRDTLTIMGVKVGALNYSPNGTLVSDPTVTSLFGSIVSIGESPMNTQVIYTGSTDGQVQVTRNGGATWTNVTANIAGVPPFTPVSTVLPSHHVAGRVYATFDGHVNNDDEHAYVFVSDDYGQHWRAINIGLPAASVYRLVEHPRSANLLAVGHARGVHFSNDGGATWQALNTNMPTVPVPSLAFQARDNSLIAGTYGRGIYILDDVGPLETLTTAAVQRPATLVSITRARQWNTSSLSPTYGAGEFYAPNPEWNPVVSYYLHDGAAAPSTIVISDAGGRVVRTLRGSVQRGLNRVTWDMYMESAMSGGGADAAPAESGRGGRGGGRGGRGGGRGAGGESGPLVLPGKYSVSITVPGIAQPLRGNITVEADPMDGSAFTSVQRHERQDLLLAVYDLQRSLVVGRRTAQSLGAQTDAIRRALSRGAGGAALAAALTERIGRSQAEVDRLVGYTGTLMRGIESFNAPPTADHRQQLAWAREDAASAVAAINRIIQTDLPKAYSQFAPGEKAPSIAPITPASRPERKQ